MVCLDLGPRVLSSGAPLGLQYGLLRGAELIQINNAAAILNGLLKILEGLLGLHIYLILVYWMNLLFNPNHFPFDASLFVCQSQMIFGDSELRVLSMEKSAALI